MKSNTIEDLRAASQEEQKAMAGVANAIRHLHGPIAAMVLCNVLVGVMRALGAKRKVFREMCMRTWDGAVDLESVQKAAES